MRHEYYKGLDYGSFLGPDLEQKYAYRGGAKRSTRRLVPRVLGETPITNQKKLVVSNHCIVEWPWSYELSQNGPGKRCP